METIAAIASPHARSTRGVIRLSGPQAHAAVRAICAGPPIDACGLHVAGEVVAHVGPRLPRGTYRARIRLDQFALPVLVAAFAAPRSYTGEDAAEIILPGNPALLQRVLASLIATGLARLAHPGEFSARAYLSGRLTLDQAEGVAALIAADSADDLRDANDLLSGRTGAEYRDWADSLANVLALVESGIDFADQEDVVAISGEALAAALDGLLAPIAARAAGPRLARSGLARVVLAGAPNAGKSTLMNALLGRRRVVESPVAGSTRDAIEEPLDLGPPTGGTVLLVDLPGLESEAAADGTNEIGVGMQSLSRESLRGADVVLHCDAAGEFAPLATEARVIRVRTKADRPVVQAGRMWQGDEEAGVERSGTAPEGRGTQSTATVAVCALDGRNLSVLRRAIADVASGRGLAALPRHREALGRARDHLAEARRLAISGASEVVAQELRLALDALGEVVGRIPPDEVLGRVFSAFCIGK
ncbi:MAG: tRNA modification GTPase [Phycisphaerales bacterium]